MSEDLNFNDPYRMSRVTTQTSYSVIKADSLDATVALAKGCPVLQGGAKITVYETFDVM